MRPRLVCLIVLAAGASLHAQWLKYPTAGVPRMPDGRPNLSAPAPRAADGKPDLSGIWQLQPRPCPPEGCGDYAVGSRVPEFWRAAARWSPLSAVGRGTRQGAHRAARTRRPGWLLQARRRAQDSHVSTVQEVSPAARLVRHPRRSATSPTARSSSTDVRCPTIPRRHGTGTQSANGTVTRSSSRRSAFATIPGSIATAAR